jgi:CRISPR-associated protein Csm2
MAGDWKEQLSKQAKNMGIKPLTPEPTPAVSAKPAESSQDYVKEAETVILGIAEKSNYGYRFKLTTSKLRNILSLVNQIYNEVILFPEEKLPAAIQDKIKYLRVRIVYEAGRDRFAVKPFVDKARLLAKIEDIGGSRKKFLEFSRYMEALVAYHRFYGGND